MSAVERLEVGEFTRHFTDHLLKISTGKTSMSEAEVREYATETAPSYFEDYTRQQPFAETPEDCAATDFGYWED